jgi:protein MBA1
LSQFPRPLGQKFRLLGYWIVIKGQETITNAFHRFMSKPTLFSRARFKPKRSTLIPTAKALHRAMAEALASGDKDTINKVCGSRLASQLLASIDARPRGRRYGWELVGYTNKLFYPSVKSHKISPVSRERHAPIIQQAVVAISSRQRRVEYDAHGQVVPGSEKEIEVVENVAISCMVDTRTWTQGEWRVVGSVRPTTLEGWKAEAELLKTTMLQQ